MDNQPPPPPPAQTPVTELPEFPGLEAILESQNGERISVYYEKLHQFLAWCRKQGPQKDRLKNE